MPELPEVETTVGGVRPHLVGRYITEIKVHQRQFRVAPNVEDMEKHLPAQRIEGVYRNAKYIVVDVGNGFLVYHLGMSGNLKVLPVATERLKHDHIELFLADKAKAKASHVLRLNDMRRFGGCWYFRNDELVALAGQADAVSAITAAATANKSTKAKSSSAQQLGLLDPEGLRYGYNITPTDPYLKARWDGLNQSALFAGNGPDALSDAFNADYLTKVAKGVKKPIKSWLMDNKVVIGVGNIYANEALYQAGLNPYTLVGTVEAKTLAALVDIIKATLKKSLAAGGTTFKDFVKPDGKPGYFAQELKVYGKRGQYSPADKDYICVVTIGGRSTFFVPSKQPWPDTTGYPVRVAAEVDKGKLEVAEQVQALKTKSETPKSETAKATAKTKASATKQASAKATKANKEAKEAKATKEAKAAKTAKAPKTKKSS